jgi:hypothetical protein
MESTAFDGCPKWMRKENSQLFNDMRWNIIFLGHKLVFHYISLHISAAFLLPSFSLIPHTTSKRISKKMLIKCHKRSRQEKKHFCELIFCYVSFCIPSIIIFNNVLCNCQYFTFHTQISFSLFLFHIHRGKMLISVNYAECKQYGIFSFVFFTFLYFAVLIMANKNSLSWLYGINLKWFY